MAAISNQVILPSREAKELLPARLAVRYSVVPLRIENGELIVAMEDPRAYDVLDELRMALGHKVRGEAAPATAIAQAIRDYYGVGADTLDTLSISRGVATIAVQAEAATDDLAADASIVKFVNQLFVDAYNSRATDIHFEPFENRLRVRYRIDGILFDAQIPESIRHFRESIVTRIKIMANMDIAERRLPQDGRIRARISAKDLDLRVSVIPIAHGESVNVRILQRSNVLMGLDAIGFEEDTVRTLAGLIAKPHGIVLVTGPTGSGKTTTLYACLSLLNDSERKVLTIEDPVEYQIEGICQMQVRADIGFTFANGLRSMLRHDPDIMMVGEIRDAETAELAIRCSLTGHLVFSTLHTNDAPGAFPRLIDMGVEPYLLASTIEAVMAQRLVRTICPHCAVADEQAQEKAAELGESFASNGPAPVFKRGKGCEVCRGSGYFGRTAIYELMLTDDEVRKMIVRRAPSTEIKAVAMSHGFSTLRASGWAKACSGVTTIDEVLRVTQDDLH